MCNRTQDDTKNHIGFLPSNGAGDGDCSGNRPCSPVVHQTHSNIAATATRTTARSLVYHQLLSINVGAFQPGTDDVYPPLASATKYFFRESRWDQVCTTVGAGTASTAAPTNTCGFWWDPNASALLPDVSSGLKLLTPTGSIAWRLFTLSPMLPVPGAQQARIVMPTMTSQTLGWAFLGELDKWVPVSPQRFASITSVLEDDAGNVLTANGKVLTADGKVLTVRASATDAGTGIGFARPCVHWFMTGEASERVTITVVSPAGNYVRQQFSGNTCLPSAATRTPCKICEQIAV